MDLFDAAKKPTQEAEILVLVPASQLCDTYFTSSGSQIIYVWNDGVELER